MTFQRNRYVVPTMMTGLEKTLKESRHECAHFLFWLQASPYSHDSKRRRGLYEHLIKLLGIFRSEDNYKP